MNKTNPLATEGNKLVKAYASLIKHIWIQPDRVFSPIRIKQVLGSINQCFKGYE